MENLSRQLKTTTKVSSVLERNTKEYGKQYLFDDKDDTCWNSDQGLPQWVWVEFESPVCLKAMEIQFQGGFAGQECVLTAESEECRFYPKDNNSLQHFEIPEIKSKSFKLIIEKSTDFFGRIIIYKMNLLGNKLE
ncbi:nuclear receptor 2C2-associated protein-like [Artemia franciscana]|uniref:nuclear receptor 2C2-associated protein-like n=1 Tax=Artemia franciscana TaxID=6661 RepID=UPI0032DA4A41